MKNKYIVKYYMSQLKKQIRISSPTKKRFLQTLKQNVEIFLEEQPDVTYEKVLCVFGTPEEVASSFYETLEQPEIDQQLYRKHFFIVGCCIIILSLLLLCGWYSHRVSQSVLLYEFEEIQRNVPAQP